MVTFSSPSSATIQRFSGFADQYDRHRPQPPRELAKVLAESGGWTQPALVVDLGSGTGLSTRYWVNHALQVIGIEPSADMRQQAVEQSTPTNVRYCEGYSHQTGLSSTCAQVITCVQSLHWMEPQATFEEARRLLVPGGIFAAVDYDWPPVTGSWRAEQCWNQCTDTVLRLESALPRDQQPPRWDKQSHLSRMRASGCFRYSRELLLHHWDHGNRARYVGLLRSQGGVMDLLKAGHAEEELGITAVEMMARSEIDEAARPWFWSARVRVGIV